MAKAVSTTTYALVRRKLDKVTNREANTVTEKVDSGNILRNYKAEVVDNGY